MYHFKNQITNTIPEVADKVNFFADCFDFTLSELGKCGFPDLENHKSLLEKIKFQLENYSKYSDRYIDHYLKHPYLAKEDLLIKQYYPSGRAKVFAARSACKNLSAESDRNRFMEAVSELNLEMEGTLFNNALSNIIKVILSRQPLQPKSIRCIQYNTPILATEFIFAGFPIKYLNHVFDRILKKEIEFENNKVKTEAPLPKSLLDLMNDENPEPFYQAAKSYLEQRNLKQQFEGLFFLFKNYEQKKVFLFRLDDIVAVGDIAFTYHDVVISNTFKKDYVVEGSTNEFYSDFFSGENTLFAKVEILGNNNDGSLEKAKRKVLEALDYFNSTLKKSAKINQSQYILKDRNDNFRRVNSSQAVHSDDVAKLTENNLYGALSSSQSRLAKRMLEIEKIYFAAKSSPFKEVRLVNYWRYLECFFEASDFDAANIEATISQILSVNFLFEYAWTHFYLTETIFSAAYFRSRQYYEYFGISEKEYELLTTPPSADDIDFDRIVEVINHPYVTTKLREYMTTTPEVLSENMRMYYQKLLLETYEQRNLIEHAGTFQEKAVEKVLIRLPFVVGYIRNLITQCVLTKKFISFKDILLFLKDNDFYALSSEESPIS